MNRRVSSFLAVVGMFCLFGLAIGCSDSEIENPASGGGTVGLVEAILSPVILVDASGRAVSEDRSGFLDDRFDVEIEIDQSGFGAVGIDVGDGFQDEAVTIAVTRGSTEVLAATPLPFSQDRRATQGDITFEVNLRGGGVPQLLPGDVARVVVNGVFLLQGTFSPK
jgi:hypothetical protein